jgi:uncharacterized membrane protein YidH (DUF202 family)
MIRPRRRLQSPCCPSHDATIKHFGDYSAIEGTFLAWIRTSIAVMALPWARQVLNQRCDLSRQRHAQLLGLGLVILGITQC